MVQAPWLIQEYHRKLLGEERGSGAQRPGRALQDGLDLSQHLSGGAGQSGPGVVYGLLNRQPDILCERVFLPDRTSLPLYEKSRTPLLSLESSRPLDEFDLVLVTFSFENDAPNLGAMLQRGGLGLNSAGRPGPLVIAGGVAAMLNPEPYAELMDGFLLGEAEVVLLPMVEKLREHWGLEREGLLLKLAQEVEGFYAPRFYRPSYNEDGQLSAFEPLAQVPARIAGSKYRGPADGFAQSVFQAKGPEFGQMRLFEVGRGCAHGCRFCAAGHILRPPRLGRAEDFMVPALQAAAMGSRSAWSPPR